MQTSPTVSAEQLQLIYFLVAILKATQDTVVSARTQNIAGWLVGNKTLAYLPPIANSSKCRQALKREFRGT